ncbi:hypothetical protein [Agrococcus casei]
MTDLHIEMRYGLPEFTFDLPDGWQLEPLTKATVDKTVELVLGPESPAAERDRLTESVRADLHRDRAFALVRFDDESRGHSRVWLSLQALTAPADSSIGHLASRLIAEHDATLLDDGGRVLRWTRAGEGLHHGRLGRTDYLIPSPEHPESKALHVVGWTLVTDGHRPAEPAHIELLLQNQAAIVLCHRWSGAEHVAMRMAELESGRIS